MRRPVFEPRLQITDDFLQIFLVAPLKRAYDQIALEDL